MCDFQPIAPEHKALFDECLAAEPTESSGSSFGNVFLWDLYCRRNVARLGGRLGIEFLCPRGPFFAYPSGSGELGEAVDALRRRAEEAGRPLRLRGLTPDERDRLEAACPGAFSFTECRGDFDYVCSVESVAGLAGKKLHGKRNFCHRFEAQYDWRFAPLTPAEFPDCLTVLDAWSAAHPDTDREEDRAIRRLFALWESLGMEGGVLYADGEPVAFTAAERLNGSTMDIHFEKAREDIPGAYPMVAREYARQVRARHPEVLYLNREEDMDLPNLRRAKEEWHPLFLVKKYTADWRGKA